jgi:anti-sigma factor RsiW
MSREHLSIELLLRCLDRELSAGEQYRVEEHLDACAGCRAQLENLRGISEGIDQYSADLLRPTPAGRRRALTSPLEHESGRRKVYAALAMAASVLLAVGLSLRHQQPPAPVAHTIDTFIALPDSNESLSGAGAVVMQVEVPRDAVALAGVPAAEGSSGLVKAEVVVGADGLARAIRFLN